MIPPGGKPMNRYARVNKRLPTATDYAVGTQIRSLRLAAGMTLKELGEAVGVSHVQFQRYETGVSRVAAGRLFAISEALGVRVDRLIVDAMPTRVAPVPRARRAESTELLRVFNTISDPRHRMAIIAFARTIAAGQGHPQGSSLDLDDATSADLDDSGADLGE
jgi:transcriptional regulator with XRE-family HTH domain